MNILFVDKRYPNFGGISTVVTMLAKKFVADGHNVYVATLMPRLYEGIDELIPHGVSVIQLKQPTWNPKNIKIRTDKTDGDEDWESNFTIITKSSMPAVLTENFFQDNKSDVAYLNSKAGKKDVIDIHIKGIEKYADYKFKK